jgi:CheY-like chemotaxis protein
MAVILVVEDDAANQELVTRFLKREGHTVYLAVDGKSGVSAAQQHVPDLIVMDLGLPGMDGWEAAPDQVKPDDFAYPDHRADSPCAVRGRQEGERGRVRRL